MAHPVDPGTFDQWITDRLAFTAGRSLGKYTGTFDQWITDRMYYESYAEEEVFPSSSPSPSISPSVSPSLSPSASESPSISPSTSASPSAGSSFITGSVCWGHVSGVVEDHAHPFAGNWSGTGHILNAGDAELVELHAGENMVSEMVETGVKVVELDQNHYDAGDNVELQYRVGTTPAFCDADDWNLYTVPFLSEGYVRVRIVSTL